MRVAHSRSVLTVLPRLEGVGCEGSEIGTHRSLPPHDGVVDDHFNVISKPRLVWGGGVPFVLLLGRQAAYTKQ